MTGAEIIALVSVITTGLTALGVPWLAERLGQRRFALETRVSRDDELREKLDAAATRLSESIQRLAAVERDGSVWDAEMVAAIAADHQQMPLNLDTLGIRLGEDAAEYAAYENARKAHDKAVELMRGHTPRTAWPASDLAELGRLTATMREQRRLVLRGVVRAAQPQRADTAASHEAPRPPVGRGCFANPFRIGVGVVVEQPALRAPGSP